MSQNQNTPNLSDMISQLLSDPQKMQQFSQMASSLGLGGNSQQTNSPSAPDLSSLLSPTPKILLLRRIFLCCCKTLLLKIYRRNVQPPSKILLLSIFPAFYLLSMETIMHKILLLLWIFHDRKNPKCSADVFPVQS